MHSILGLFCCIFRENYILYVIIYTLFPILCLSMVFFYVMQVFGPFCPCFDPNWVYFDFLCMALSYPTCGEERRIKECWDKGDHGPSVVMAIVHGKPKTDCLFIFLHLLTKNARVYAWKGLFSCKKKEELNSLHSYIS